jgi:hypothetical protein
MESSFFMTNKIKQQWLACMIVEEILLVNMKVLLSDKAE